jgi:hypothetical protein
MMPTRRAPTRRFALVGIALCLLAACNRKAHSIPGSAATGARIEINPQITFDAIGLAHVSDAVVLPHHQLALLEWRARRIVSFDSLGRLVSSIAATAQSWPAPNALLTSPDGSLLLVDGRKGVIRADSAGSATNSFKATLRRPFDACVLRGNIIVNSRGPGPNMNPLHRIGRDGNIELSFGAAADSAARITGPDFNASIACADTLVALATPGADILQFFTAHGEFAGGMTIPDYHGVLTKSDADVNEPEDLVWNGSSGDIDVTWISPSRLLVQYEEVRRGMRYLRTVFFDVATGWLPNPPQLPRVIAIDGDVAFAALSGATPKIIRFSIAPFTGRTQ